MGKRTKRFKHDDTWDIVAGCVLGKRLLVGAGEAPPPEEICDGATAVYCRYYLGAPNRQTSSGRHRPQDADDFYGYFMASLHEPGKDAPSAKDILAENNIKTGDDLSALLRVIAADAAYQALLWAGAISESLG